MGKRFFLSFAAFVLCALSLMAYPTIEMGGLYKGLDQTEMKSNPPKYVFQKFMSEEEYTQLFPLKQIGEKKYTPNRNVLMQKLNFHGANIETTYMRLYDQSGKVIWHSTTLRTPLWEEDELGDPNKNGEYEAEPENWINDSIILVNKRSNRFVLKLNNGVEYPLPFDSSIYSTHVETEDIQSGRSIEDFCFICLGQNHPFELAVVSEQGAMKGWCKTNVKVRSIDSITKTLKQDRLLIKYADLQGQCGLMIISTDGKLIKNYPNISIESVQGISYRSNAPDFILIVLEDRWRTKLIVNTETGEIVASLCYSSIDLTQIGDKLIALVDKSGAIAVIDILNAKLIQDFTDFGKPPEPRRVYTIGLLHISVDAKDIYFERCYKDKASEILYYRIKE